MLEYKVSKKENIYFIMKILATVLFLAFIINIIGTSTPQTTPLLYVFSMYGVMILLFVFIQKVILLGHVRNNGVQITENQFKEVHDIYLEQTKKMGFYFRPALYTIQSGGMLNAFATRFIGSDYIVIYSDILELAYEEGNEAVEFIIAHELGHVHRKHMSKNFWLFPSIFVPFLSQAYSRACETTCDNIGHALCEKGGLSGMLILAAGKQLYNKINIDNFIKSYRDDSSFWKWLAEILSTHPPIPKRVLNLKSLNKTDA